MRYSLVFLLGLLMQFSVAQDATNRPPSERIIDAVRVTTPPKIDGILDDEVWKKAPIATNFIQTVPNPGQKASQKTEVRIVYDNSAIYISAVLHDVSKDSILRQLSQRDEDANTDYFAVFFDTYDDDQNGYGFLVQPTGVQVDARYSSAIGEDILWNAVWLSEVTYDDNGWYVEMKIPYSAIRFPENAIQEWGINFQRSIRRNRETSNWNQIDPRVNGFVNQWGKLQGVKDIEAPVRLMFSPYISTYLEHYPYNIDGSSNYSKSINGGMDVKYGINDAFTLDVTLIPDFGQVQSDNQVLNLSPFEVRFNENRPFFMEGTELFNKGGLFYSRRLGGTPIDNSKPYDQLGANEEVSENPSETQLVNATKISGRTKGGLGIGVFNGVTKKMFASIKDTITGDTRQVLTDPLTNYNVLVLDQNLKNNSYVTLINTNVTRSGSYYDANVTGGQLKINNKKNTLSITALGVLSQKYMTDSLSLGHTAGISLNKQGGNFEYGIGFYEESDTYDPNDLGFLYNNNSRGGDVYLAYKFYEPYWKFLKGWAGLDADYERLYAPDRYAEFSTTLDFGVTFKNWLTTGLFLSVEPIETINYFEPRVWGRYYAQQESNNVGGFISSDYRKAIALDLRMNYRKFNADGRYRLNFSGGPLIRFSDKLSMKYTLGRSQYVEDEGAAIDINGVGTIINSDIIFAKRNQTTYENILSASFIFTNRMGLTLRARHYWSTVDYNSFHILDYEGHLTPSLYTGVDLDGQSLHNTNFNAFNVDMVYRWVFAPGSEISVVFKSALIAFDGDVSSSYSNNFKNTLESPQTKSISLKVLFYIDYLSLKKKKIG